MSMLGLESITMILSMINTYFTVFTGIFYGKSWVKAMRAHLGVSAALLKQFLSSGLKTFEQIEHLV